MPFWKWSKQKNPVIAPHTARQLQQLCQVLRELIQLLEADGETHWQNWMAESLKDLEANNLRGAEHLRGAYGGMGSFNDLIIGQRLSDKGFEWAPGASDANDQLDALRSQAYGLAMELLAPSK